MIMSRIKIKSLSKSARGKVRKLNKISKKVRSLNKQYMKHRTSLMRTHGIHVHKLSRKDLKRSPKGQNKYVWATYGTMRKKR